MINKEVRTSSRKQALVSLLSHQLDTAFNILLLPPTTLLLHCIAIPPVALRPRRLLQELCSQIAELDIKAKKKAKLDKILCFTNLGFQSVLEEIKPLKEIEYKLLILR